MTRYGKLFTRVLDGRADSNIRFDDLRGLLNCLDFQERKRGSHHIFIRDGVEDLINLQRDGHMAKSYQVKQVRDVINKHNLKLEKE